MSLPELRPPSTLGYPSQSLPGSTQEVTSNAGDTAFEYNALAYDNSTLDRFHIEDQLSSATPGQKHDFRNKEVAWFLDLGEGDEETMYLPAGSLEAGTRSDGFQRPDKRKRAMTPDEGRKVRRTLPKRSQSLESREETQVSTVATRLKYLEGN